MATYHYIDIEKCEKATEAEAEAMGGGTFYKCPVNGKFVGVSVVYPGKPTDDDEWRSHIEVSLCYPGSAMQGTNIASVVSTSTNTPTLSPTFVNKSQFFITNYYADGQEDPLTEEQKIRLYLVIEGTEGRCPC